MPRLSNRAIGVAVRFVGGRRRVLHVGTLAMICSLAVATTRLCAADGPPTASSVAPSADYAAVADVFARRCLGCHGSEEPESKLSLASFEALLKGGKRGAAIVPGSSADSRLVRMLTGREAPAMPPQDNEPPTADEVALLSAWIDAGAPGPTGAAPDRQTLITPHIDVRGTARMAWNAVAWSSDGARLALGGARGVEIVEVESRAVVARLREHPGAVTDVAFSADGTKIISASGEPGMFGEARLWDVASQRLVRAFRSHADSLYCATLSPGGDILATAGYDQKIKLWDVATGNELRTIAGHSGAVFDLAFSPDGKRLASASADRTVKLWDAATGARLDTFSQATKEQTAVAFSPDGQRIAAGGSDNRIRVWQLSPTAAEGTNSLFVSRFAHQAPLLRVEFSPDGKQLLSTAEDRTVRLWKLAGENDTPSSEMVERLTLGTHSDWPAGAAFAPDGARLAVARLDGTYTIYTAADGKPVSPGKPELATAAPRGLQRGATTRVLLRGARLIDVALAAPPSGVSWSIVDARSDQLDVDIHVEADGPPNVEIAITTPGGTSNAISLVVDSLAQQAEVGATPEAPQVLALPVGLWGVVDAQGEIDLFEFTAEAGQTIVCELAAATLGSKLDGVLAVLDSAGKVLVTNNDFEGQGDPLVAFTPESAGRYRIRVSDLQAAGSAAHFYRLSLGAFPYVTGVFPLSVPANAASSVELVGYNLPADARISLPATAMGEIDVPLAGTEFRARRGLKVLVGSMGEQLETEPNDEPERAVAFTAPAALGGRIEARLAGASADRDLFRFHSKAQDRWVIEVEAARRGSPVDTIVEVLTADGKPVPRVRLAAVRDSAITFRPINSVAIDVRLTNWEEMELNQYLYMEGEVARLFRLPQGPDSGFLLYNWQGTRVAYFDTSPTTHAVDEPVYIVEPVPPLVSPPETGLPVFTLNYQNDDDGQRRLGRDSRLAFVAPASADYLIAVRDVRGLGGPSFGYRLVVRRPQPDFFVSVEGLDPTIPPGSGRVVRFSADRRDGFDGPIDVEIENLPSGFAASGTATIEAGQSSAAIVVSAAMDAPTPTADALARVAVRATAQVQGASVVKPLGGLGKIQLAAAPKLRVQLSPAEVVIPPGSTVTAQLRVERAGFDGPVTFEVANLPHGVYVDNIGLNGVLIPEGQSERTIFFTARPWVAELSRRVAAIANNAGGEASPAIVLTVRPGAIAQASATNTGAAVPAQGQAQNEPAAVESPTAQEKP